MSHSHIRRGGLNNVVEPKRGERIGVWFEVDGLSTHLRSEELVRVHSP